MTLYCNRFNIYSIFRGVRLQSELRKFYKLLNEDRNSFMSSKLVEQIIDNTHKIKRLIKITINN